MKSAHPLPLSLAKEDQGEEVQRAQTRLEYHRKTFETFKWKATEDGNEMNRLRER